MFTQLKHFKEKNEFTSKRWVFAEDAPETASTAIENLAKKTPAELMEMLRQEGADLEGKKEVVRSLIGKLEQSTIAETLKKSIRDEVSEILTTMEDEENALEIHRLRFELAGTIKAEGMSDVAEWWEKIKIVSPTKNAIIASFKSLKEMDWKEMLDGGLDKLMEYGGMIISFISGGQLRRGTPASGQETTETPVEENSETPETQTTPEPVIEYPLYLRRLDEIMEPSAVEGTELITFKTNTGGSITEWQINLDGSPLFKKQEDGEFRTANGNFKEMKDEDPLPWFTDYLSSHYNDLREIANNIKEQNESEGIWGARLLAGVIKLQQLENRTPGIKLDVLSSIKQNFSPEEQRELILRTSASDIRSILTVIREKKFNRTE